ncbi:MAG: Gfo/Idh/MocA family oxidoreductase [Anaerolineales bacterium]|nr:Gfo/Idh/MocA family oxidoreductase [Anaerolineales bacterium]
MKILIAGFGSIGRRHFHNLLALGERDIIFYRTGQSTLNDAELDGFTIEPNLEAALAHQPEAVIVANPTALHLSVAIPAAEAGCSLLLEKPISDSLAGLDDLRSALQRGGGRVLVGFQYRYHPGLERVARLLQENALGRPLSVRVHWGEYLPGWHPWEDYRRGYSARKDLGGGVVLTLSHPLDYLRWLFGEISALWAFTGFRSELELEVEDTAEIGLRFSNGVLGSVHLNYNQRPPRHDLEIVGSGGTLRWDNADGAAKVYRAAGPGTWETYSLPEGFERDWLFRAQLAHFLEVAAGQAEPRCTLTDGIRALELALAAHISSDQAKLQKF